MGSSEGGGKGNAAISGETMLLGSSFDCFSLSLRSESGGVGGRSAETLRTSDISSDVDVVMSILWL